jgi:hemolysin D
MRASMAERQKLMGVLRERVASAKTLADKGVGTRARFLELSQLLYEAGAALETERGQIREGEANIERLNQRLAQTRSAFLAEAMANYVEAKRRESGLTQELIKADTRDKRNSLRAPVDGLVQSVAVHTVGDVVTTGEQLMIVVPEGGALEVEAMVLNRDKGFVSVGDEAAVKVESFPFTRYGTVPGRVTRLSNDAVATEDGALVFPARILLAKQSIFVDGEETILTPGMAVTAEVKTGSRHIIEYLLTPLLRYKNEAIRER